MKQRLKDRRKRAQELLAQRATRTDKQQLARLDKMLGKGKGAQRERARLKAKEEARKNAVPKDHQGKDRGR